MSAPLDSGIPLGQIANGFCLKCPPDTAFLSPARLLFERWLGLMKAPVDGWDVIITELLSNAMNASPPESEIELEVCAEGDLIRCQVSNDGEWDDLQLSRGLASDLESLGNSRPAKGQEAASDRGRGLVLVNHLADRTSAKLNDGRTAVTVWRSY